jgi:hypothetical protein
MGKIRLLTDEVASQVAAGEVVERPASVVKELVENSIDAGARRIRVEFVRGGTQLIRVEDDGSGMNREDALLSLERHATSKIRSAADLAAVGTMGFRGEAVPSIASVSRFRLVTRPSEADVGTEIQISGGKIESVVDSGGAPGTSIEVRSLFFNLPARKKFLRGEETDWKLKRLSYNHPGLAVDLGVGLWAWPLPLDHDDDGDLDLLVSCPDKPSNGIYYFENPTQDPKVKMPVFKPGVRLGPTGHNVQVSYVDGKPRILKENQEYVDFKKKGFDKPETIYKNGKFHPGNTRARMWRYLDYEFKSGDALQSMSMNGALLGVAFQF